VPSTASAQVPFGLHLLGLMSFFYVIEAGIDSL
jgi:hypothetical protein